MTLSEYEEKLQRELDKIEREEEEERHISAIIEDPMVPTVPSNMPNLQRKNDELRKQTVENSPTNSHFITRAIQIEQAAARDSRAISQD